MAIADLRVQYQTNMLQGSYVVIDKFLKHLDIYFIA